MIDTYQSIFTKRALSYHNAMIKFPDARKEEFEQLLQYVSVDKENTVADMPAGGCYLKNYIDNDIYFLDPTQEFLDNCPCGYNTIKTSLDDTLIKDSYFDTIFSLAGSHHIENKDSFYTEVHRLLKHNGNFIYADVLKGSKEDTFLNIFVNKHNSLGHTGIFLDDSVKTSLQDIGFKVNKFEYVSYHWNFANEQAMVEYIKNLFGLDLASDEIILSGIKDILSYSQKNDCISMNWGLIFISSVKSN